MAYTMHPIAIRQSSALRFAAVVLGLIGYVLTWVIYSTLAPDQVYLPHPENILLLLIVLLLVATLNNIFAKGIFSFWSIWLIIGTVSIFAQTNLTTGLNYAIDVRVANRFYLLCVLAAVTGAHLVEFFGRKRGKSEYIRPRSGNNPLFWSAIALFPFLYALTIIISTGGIPLFSGKNVSTAMYEVSYGPLHSFGIFTAVACMMFGMKLNDRSSFFSQIPINFAVLGLLVLFLIIASFDGRRAITLFAFMGLILYYLALPNRPFKWIWIGAASLTALIVYVSAAALRTGRSAASAFDNLFVPFAAIGTEYRDYVYGFANLRPAMVRGAGYDWFGSTLATLTPGFVAAPLGMDKAELIARDSARTLMIFWDVKLGIRIGLPGELWFAYEWLGILPFFIIGALIFLVADRAVKSDHFVFKSILLVILGISSLSVLGQSTVTFGLILPLVYLAAATFVVERMFPFRLPKLAIKRQTAIAP